MQTAVQSFWPVSFAISFSFFVRLSWLIRCWLRRAQCALHLAQSHSDQISVTLTPDSALTRGCAPAAPIASRSACQDTKTGPRASIYRITQNHIACIASHGQSTGKLPPTKRAVSVSPVINCWAPPALRLECSTAPARLLPNRCAAAPKRECEWDRRSCLRTRLCAPVLCSAGGGLSSRHTR